MRCPSCNSLDTQVKDSRPTEDSAVIRRRRVCVACNFRFTTFERVQLRELTVIKRNGRRVPFDRDKLVRSLQISLRKRPVDPERVEKMVSAIVRELESGGEAEISSEAIGEIVMEHLRQLDDVAYVRFASVYRNFREAKDFETVLGELSGDDEARLARCANDLPYSGRPVRPESPESKAADQRFMALALALGRRGQGRVGPTRPSARSWSRTGSSSAAAGPNRAAVPMPSRRRSNAPARSCPRRYPLCDAGAVFAFRPIAALRRRGDRGRHARVVSAIEDPNPEVAGQGHANRAPPESPSISGRGRRKPYAIMPGISAASATSARM
jgi:transcriptional repressor NrdR